MTVKEETCRKTFFLQAFFLSELESLKVCSLLSSFTAQLLGQNKSGK
ncbi:MULTISPECIES: hypothetical protein [Metabacillus]|uniref:Uncharacterized protein n=1 Tax=Metabacillus hrfriensis TaxID=3048891 RepID=A0ACD4R7G9_9BACI|nr:MULTISPECIES: hypothetical protein [Metabacillus]UAL50805.1 hypothetical protein K8L98_16415 [Metabacillus dongyingensis]USK27081.1 hypothetical protein LIT32_16510 [Bacillus sp. CMF21]WHZ56303.1 hypothetical protein QLQ22_16580 [Metabacillus sp. CT-WN-B3]